MITLDIVIPVFNEGANIVGVMDALSTSVHTPCRVLICYDHDEDDTLQALQGYPGAPFEIVPVKNLGRGPHAAVLTGFGAGDAPAVLVYPADDTHNAGIIDRMAEAAQEGCDVVVASRFIPGGVMEGCPWLKGTFVRGAAFTLHHLARLPARDASNGLRLFSRRLLERVEIESSRGFVYSIELLVKAHRLRWRVGEVPSRWYPRTQGESRFRVLRWLPAYLRWYAYVFATTYLRRGPGSVALPSLAASSIAAQGGSPRTDETVLDRPPGTSS